MESQGQEYDFEKDRPKRSFMDDHNISWRNGKPNFTIVDETYLKGRSKNHACDSLEKTVENLVKTWEMEATHKPNCKDWESVDPESFAFIINNDAKYNSEAITRFGTYNLMIQNNPLYDYKGETFESSHKLFKTAFKEGFAWEVLEVYTGPPRVVFSWRHWGHWTGPYRDHPATGELLVMYGMAVVEVNDKMQLTSVNLYFDSNQILAKLEGKTAASDSGKKACPFA